MDGAGAEAVRAVEREATRRRDEACYEAARHEAAVERLEGIAERRRVKLGVRLRIAWRRFWGGRAEDACKAQERR